MLKKKEKNCKKAKFNSSQGNSKCSKVFAIAVYYKVTLHIKT